MQHSPRCVKSVGELVSFASSNTAPKVSLHSRNKETEKGIWRFLKFFGCFLLRDQFWASGQRYSSSEFSTFSISYKIYQFLEIVLLFQTRDPNFSLNSWGHYSKNGILIDTSMKFNSSSPHTLVAISSLSASLILTLSRQGNFCLPLNV